MSIQSQIIQFDLEYFFELSPDLLCIAGYDGYFKKINPAFSKVLGYSPEELLGSPINQFIHPEDQELTLRKREQLRKGEILFLFENRYIARDGKIVHLLWTSIPAMRERLIFAIAKDITNTKIAKDQLQLPPILENLTTAQVQRVSKEIEIVNQLPVPDQSNLKWMDVKSTVSPKDQLWLNKFEAAVRNFVARGELKLKTLSMELAVSERQLFREVKRIMGISPNMLIRIIRLHLAWETIASKNYRSVADIAKTAGYTSAAHFNKLFQERYGINVSELL